MHTHRHRSIMCMKAKRRTEPTSYVLPERVGGLSRRKVFSSTNGVLVFRMVDEDALQHRHSSPAALGNVRDRAARTCFDYRGRDRNIVVALEIESHNKVGLTGAPSCQLLGIRHSCSGILAEPYSGCVEGVGAPHLPTLRRVRALLLARMPEADDCPVGSQSVTDHPAETSSTVLPSGSIRKTPRQPIQGKSWTV